MMSVRTLLGVSCSFALCAFGSTTYAESNAVQVSKSVLEQLHKHEGEMLALFRKFAESRMITCKRFNDALYDKRQHAEHTIAEVGRMMESAEESLAELDEIHEKYLRRELQEFIVRTMELLFAAEMP